jgi:hypothetical protein
MRATVAPETVHTLGVLELNVTGRRLVEVAESVSGEATVWVPGLAKLMVCASPYTTKLVVEVAAV